MPQWFNSFMPLCCRAWIDLALIDLGAGKSLGWEGGSRFSQCPTYAAGLPTEATQYPRKSRSLSVPLVQASFLHVREGTVGISVRKTKQHLSVPVPILLVCSLQPGGRGAEQPWGSVPLSRREQPWGAQPKKRTGISDWPYS